MTTPLHHQILKGQRLRRAANAQRNQRVKLMRVGLFNKQRDTLAVNAGLVVAIEPPTQKTLNNQ